MNRTSTFILSLTLAVALAANVHAAEPTSDLETTAVKIMQTALQVGDYETVETLFGTLSRKSKEKFLRDATETIEVSDLTMEEGKGTIVDFVTLAPLARISQSDSPESGIELAALLIEYAYKKTQQTQLLGRLQASLLTQEPKVTATTIPEMPLEVDPATFTVVGLPANFKYMFIPSDATVIETPGSQLQRFQKVFQQTEKKMEQKSTRQCPATFGVAALNAITGKDRAEGKNVVKMYYIGDLEGTISIDHNTKSLVVTHTEEAHAQVEDFLSSIREQHRRAAEKKVAEQPKFIPGMEFEFMR